MFGHVDLIRARGVSNASNHSSGQSLSPRALHLEKMAHGINILV